MLEARNLTHTIDFESIDTRVDLQEKLGADEFRLAMLIGLGYTSAEIGEKLGIPERTATWRVHALLNKIEEWEL